MNLPPKIQFLIHILTPIRSTMQMIVISLRGKTRLSLIISSHEHKKEKRGTLLFTHTISLLNHPFISTWSLKGQETQTNKRYHMGITEENYNRNPKRKWSKWIHHPEKGGLKEVYQGTSQEKYLPPLKRFFQKNSLSNLEELPQPPLLFYTYKQKLLYLNPNI